MDQLARHLAERTGHEPDGADVAALAAQLTSALGVVRARWPAIADLDDAFIDAIVARVEGEASLSEAVARLALPDLYLMAAGIRGDRAAIAAIERLVRDETAHAVARLGGPIAAEDVVQELLLKLLVPRDGQPGKLAAFGGHGAMHAWLRVAAVRTAISLARRRTDVAIDDEALAAIADDGDDQGLAFIKASYRAEFKRAFGAALVELPRRSRTLLRLQIIDQLTLEEIGAFYQVSRATTARWLADARRALVAATQAQLAARLGLDADAIAELTELAASNLYSTLPSLLGRLEP